MAEIVRDHSQLVLKLDRLRAQGKRIVFTNGCFDLLHVGHVRYLRGAKSLGDVLVLALNSDDSIRRIKGPNRPLLPLEDRLAILSAFEMVDYVTAFEEDSATTLLMKLKPDIQARGMDYTSDSMSEKDAGRSFGGKVIAVGDPKCHSIQDLIQRIAERFGSSSKRD